MVNLTILYHKPADQATFETRYNENLALLEKMPGIKRRQACVVLGGPGGKSPYHRILEFYFDDYDQLDSAMLSPAGKTAGADLMQFSRDAELIFADVFED